jgi:hypothetical protein
VRNGLCWGDFVAVGGAFSGLESFSCATIWVAGDPRNPRFAEELTSPVALSLRPHFPVLRHLSFETICGSGCPPDRLLEYARALATLGALRSLVVRYNGPQLAVFPPG